MSVGAHALLGMLSVRSAGVTNKRANLVTAALATANRNVSGARDLPMNAPMELSTYGYAAKNPLTWTDPTGQLIPSGSGGGGTDCRLIGQTLLGLNSNPFMPDPIAVMLCIYDCGTKCPASEDDILVITQLVYNPPFQCAARHNRRLGE